MTANFGAVLQSSFPEIEPEPSTAGANYTIENFQRLESWKTKYSTPCLIVFIERISLPILEWGQPGATGSVIVVAMRDLLFYREKIAAGKTLWAPLSEAIKELRMPHSDDGQLAGQLVACERNSRVLAVRLAKQLEVARTVEQALQQVEQVLHWDEWAQLNPEKAIGE